jgi:hypothetical protein
MPRERSNFPAYKNLLLVTGVMLVVLGVGNWAVGEARARPHADFLAQHPGPMELADDFKTALLEAPDHEREERSISRAKLEFYELVRSGGRWMVVLGGSFLLGGVLTLGGGRDGETVPPGGW